MCIWAIRNACIIFNNLPSCTRRTFFVAVIDRRTETSIFANIICVVWVTWANWVITKHRILYTWRNLNAIVNNLFISLRAWWLWWCLFFIYEILAHIITSLHTQSICLRYVHQTVCYISSIIKYILDVTIVYTT